ncbi:sugar ABC transporter substrate-binding protein [Luedemannella flava]|uniref:Sugar ABC transporter substrate-binding protein n=1 Tax=Luedemannella flava TaxID=349316 RepID=A0ABP4YM89_9ACTN
MGRSRASTVAALACAAVLLAACQKATTNPASTDISATDDGTTITMWTRSLMGSFAEQLIDEYNATHRNKIKLTVMPDDSYQQRIGAAAGAHQLPDLLAVDVLYAPNYASKGVFLDMTARVDTLPYRAELATSHMRAATHEGRAYGVPFDIDVAALFYNKALFIAAGLDGDTPPSSLAELHTFAKRINELGDGVHGFTFAGACPSCMLVSTWPMIWASGSSVLNEEGTASTIDNPIAGDVLDLYGRMYAEGLVPPSAKNESGPTWTREFSNGRVGMQAMGATALQNIREGTELQVGVAAVPGLSGGESSFVGGDVLGIGANSRHAAQAWDFISWMLSEDTQVNVLALNKNVTVRRDLANNVYAEQDPRLVILTKLAGLGQTPFAVNFGKTYNDPNGPWMFAVADAVFGDGPAAPTLERHNDDITRSLAGD